MPLPHPIPPLLPAGTKWSCHKAINISKCLFILAFGSPGPCRLSMGWASQGLLFPFLGRFGIYVEGMGFILSFHSLCLAERQEGKAF